MRNFLLLTVMTVATFTQTMAAEEVKFYINDGINNGAVKKQMEKNVAA